MEWSVARSDARYGATLEEHEGRVSVTSLTRDDSEVTPPNVVVSADEKEGRVLVEVDGSPRLAHVSRIGDTWWVHVNGRTHVVHLHERGSSATDITKGALTAPMPGTVVELHVKQGQRVREGQVLMVLEAMKMEHKITSPKAGEVTMVNYEQGDRVEMGSVLVEIVD